MRKEYFDSSYNIVLPIQYYKQINNYQFVNCLPFKDDAYHDIIRKDYLKDFCSSLVEQDVDLTRSDDVFDRLCEFTSPFDYFILDNETLLDLDLEDYYYDLSHMIEGLDTCAKIKYKVLSDFIFGKVEGYVIKIRSGARNIGNYPVDQNQAKIALTALEDCNYGDFIYYNSKRY